MNDEEIRTYLSGKSEKPKIPLAPKRPVRRRAEPEKTFKNFAATHMLCPTCKVATPVKERILLFLPDGDLYDYVCTQCGTSTGTRKAGR